MDNKDKDTMEELRSLAHRLKELRDEEYDVEESIDKLGKKLIDELRGIEGWEAMFKDCKWHHDKYPNQFFGWCNVEACGEDEIDVVKGYSDGNECVVMEIKLDKSLEEQVMDAVARKEEEETARRMRSLRAVYLEDMRVMERLGMERMDFDEWLSRRTSPEDLNVKVTTKTVKMEELGDFKYDQSDNGTKTYTPVQRIESSF